MTVKKIRKEISNSELPAKKEAVLAKFKVLFARADASLQLFPGTARLRRSGDSSVKELGVFPIDCMVSTNEGKVYYFAFGYDRGKEMENPFFIWLDDSWFKGTQLVASERALYVALSQAMAHQGRFDDQGISLRITLNN
ncbi:MAG: hypothetical protein JSS83_11220 [Cyanobacteria bacterium SZAS LIN-3]|nr:hypothetical protein [Cyanobacteria bacterium SZAS LIN-3]